MYVFQRHVISQHDAKILRLFRPAEARMLECSRHHRDGRPGGKDKVAYRYAIRARIFPQLRISLQELQQNVFNIHATYEIRIPVALSEGIVLQLHLAKVRLADRGNPILDQFDNFPRKDFKWTASLAPSQLGDIPTKFGQAVVINLLLCETSLGPSDPDLLVDVLEHFQLLGVLQLHSANQQFQRKCLVQITEQDSVLHSVNVGISHIWANKVYLDIPC